MVFDENEQKKVRKRISTGYKDTPANRKIVEKNYLKAIEEKIRLGEMVESKKIPTLKELAEEYYAKKRDEGLRLYWVGFSESSMKKHIYPIMGDRLITTISANDIDMLQTKLLKSLKVKTVKNIRVPWNGVFELALKKDLISVNPFTKANKIVENNNQKSIKNKSLKEKLGSTEFEAEFDDYKNEAADPFEEEEIIKLIDAAKGKLKNFFALSYLLGGMRPSELIALRWNQIDFEKRLVYVLGSITGYQTEAEKDLTKTDSSFRKVYISDAAMKFLEDQYKETGKFNQEVFLTNRNKPYRGSKSLNEQLQNILEQAGMKKRFLYNLRHSYASINLSTERLPLLFVSEQMGHKDPSITLQKYARYVNKRAETAEMINKAFKAFI
jgi:integrase